MTHIKSALEIALEKTESIKGDKSSLAAAEGKEEGKKLASSFFMDPNMDLAGTLKKIPKEKIFAVKEGFFQVILANLVLPRDEADIKRLDEVCLALGILTGKKAEIASLKTQLSGFLKQWLEDKKRLDETLRQQLGPYLKQKEAQLAQKYGRAVRIDPRTDPDYMKAYNKNMGSLESRYSDALTQAKEDIVAMLGE